MLFVIKGLYKKMHIYYSLQIVDVHDLNYYNLSNIGSFALLIPFCSLFVLLDHDNNNDDEIEKTLAIIIGLIAGVALLIVFLSFLRKLYDSGKGISFFCLSFLYVLILTHFFFMPFPIIKF